MKFLLINTNQIVQKLVEITAKKAGADLTTIKELNEIDNLEAYNYVIVDDDCLEGDEANALETLKDKRKCLIHNKQTSRIEGFNDYIQKPFLPTSILDVFMAEAEREGSEYASQIPEIQDTSANNLEGLDRIDENLDTDLGESLTLDEISQANNDDESLAIDSAEENLEKSITQTQDELLDSEFAETLDSALSELGDISEPNTTTEFDDEMQTLEILQESEQKEDGEAKNAESTENLGLDQDENKGDIQSEEVGKEDMGITDTELALDDLQLSEDAALKDLESELDLGDLENDELDINLSEENADLTEDSILNANLESELDENLEQIATESSEDNSSELEDLSTEETASEHLTPENLTLDDLESLDSIDSIQESEISAEASDATNTAEENLDLEDIENEGELSVDLTSEPTENTESADSMEIAEDFEGISIESATNSESATETNLDEFPSSILDSEQIQEVSQALNALESSPDQESLEENETDSLEIPESIKTIDAPDASSQTINQDTQNDDNDFNALQEPEIAQVLGEEFATLDGDESEQAPVDSITTTQETDVASQESTLNISQTDVVKNIIASSVQSSISSLSAGNLKAMLDGLEVTINISFKDKSK